MEALDVMAASENTPAVARRTVRLAIKDARTAKGLTQTQVAEAMEWSLSKVMRIESGEVTISQNDLRPLLAYLGVREKSRVDDLVQAAKASKQRRQWWDQPKFAGLLTPAMKQWFSYEVEATSMRIFCAVYFPGFLQTPDFARSMVAFFNDELTEAEIAARIETRALRRQGLAARKVKPNAQVLLDQSVLLRTMGQPEMLGRQLSDLLSAIEEGWVTARVMPFTHPSPGIGNWEIFYLGAEDLEHAVLYRENSTKDEIIDDEAGLLRHLSQWDKMWHGSFDEVASRKMIETHMTAHLGNGNAPQG
ncbi:helix-turn-helix transcriptional regulator [Dactylosporangium aurantiacum]|uniref:Helix-turn-helix transcriptional regulator n=1 Tax=Dactylosporangium aurantiacum TaxID=35754 RepID=A0A9Q9IE39_9ACTN|nr:helix-turn-helix transcriptional regulator [Dactylosporangium aurantiacum]MDG6107578.1 helix-turn-helix transcriptional regulator [Dactylosporangium aurantiacum]UWZ54362.1 helix-turn-helix transcriptional regulator [Dactylosporangium aurantiacum]